MSGCRRTGPASFRPPKKNNLGPAGSKKTTWVGRDVGEGGGWSEDEVGARGAGSAGSSASPGAASPETAALLASDATSITPIALGPASVHDLLDLGFGGESRSLRRVGLAALLVINPPLLFGALLDDGLEAGFLGPYLGLPSRLSAHAGGVERVAHPPDHDDDAGDSDPHPPRDSPGLGCEIFELPLGEICTLLRRGPGLGLTLRAERCEFHLERCLFLGFLDAPLLGEALLLEAEALSLGAGLLELERSPGPSALDLDASSLCGALFLFFFRLHLEDRVERDVE